jgi:SpoVK/Ycf46/Vps4 family AAA+-type ATPase
MIDMSTYMKIHKSNPDWEDTDRERRRNAGLRFDTWPDTISNNQQVKDQNLTIMPPNIHGFDFREKEWISLCVDAISDISWNKEAYDRLVLPSKTKELIQALVTVQVSGKMQDIIANKGNGLILLLHGSPGTGKTLTAETVAEMAEKPLYRVTCGDIGTDAEKVEKYLTSIFYLGRIWGCVLLLDEADVFLEERRLADLQRNSLVSVFLRMLEYYDGILILTSNRVGTFDAAFKSRIQVALHYSKLSRASSKKIWRNFLDMLEEAEEEVDVNELERHLDDLSNDDMNGRQIRNCMTTARQLAAFRNQKLGWQHLEQAIKTAREFEGYLKEVHENMTEDEMAREDNLR